MSKLPCVTSDNKMADASRNQILELRLSIISNIQEETDLVKFKLLFTISECEKVILIINRLAQKISEYKSK